MPEPLRGAALGALLLAAAGCQTTDDERAAHVAQCREQGHMLGEAALEDCVRQLSRQPDTSFTAKTGSCVAFCNR